MMVRIVLKISEQNNNKAKENRGKGEGRSKCGKMLIWGAGYMGVHYIIFYFCVYFKTCMIKKLKKK